MVVSDPDDANVNALYSVIKIYSLKDVLSPGLRLYGIARILRANIPQNSYRWV